MLKMSQEGAAVKSVSPTADRTALAIDRTWLAHERTLMAWVRTAASMISFGFTVYKFFQYESGNNATRARNGIFTPRDFAIFLVSIGLVSLLLATVGHRRQTRELREYLTNRRYSLAELVAGLISLFGLVVLIATILRA